MASSGQFLFAYNSVDVDLMEDRIGSGGFTSRPCSSTHVCTLPWVFLYNGLLLQPSPLSYVGQQFHASDLRPL